MADMMRGSEDAVMALPLYHAYGYSVQHSLVELGLDTLLVPDARDTDMIADLIEDHEPLVVLGVPTQLINIVNGDLEQDIIDLLRSAPLATEIKSNSRCSVE